MITTNGDTLEKLLYNLYTKSSFIAKDITIRNFGIDSMISGMSATKYQLQNFQKDLRQGMLTGQTNVSDLNGNAELAKGVVSLKDLKLKTKYSAATAQGAFNIYDFGLKISSIFAFRMIDQYSGHNNWALDDPIRLPIEVGGTLFEPSKTPDNKELLEFIQNRQQNRSGLN